MKAVKFEIEMMKVGDSPWVFFYSYGFDCKRRLYEDWHWKMEEGWMVLGDKEARKIRTKGLGNVRPWLRFYWQIWIRTK